MKTKQPLIRMIYLYLISAITIIIILIGSIGIVNMLIKEYIFDVKSWGKLEEDYSYKCDLNNIKPFYENITTDNDIIDTKLTDEEKKVQGKKYSECIAKEKEKQTKRDENDFKRDMATWISMLLIALPLYVYHWSIVKKEN